MTEHDEIDVNFPGAPLRQSMPQRYPELLESVSQRIATGQHRAVRSANQLLVQTYWAIGGEILRRQQEEGWGTKVITRLAADLKVRFPQTHGFSERNLKYMRAFAAAWPDESVVQRAIAQLPWRHQIAALDKIKDPQTRLWYLTEAKPVR